MTSAAPKHFMKPMLLAFALALVGSCSTPDPRCQVFVDKIIRCDRSAQGVPRSTLEAQCQGSGRLHCTAIDIGTAAGCGRFMGCLYDG